MRKDINKVVTEQKKTARRKRKPVTGERKLWQKLVKDEGVGAQRESSSRRKGWGYGSYPRTGVLRRFIGSRVGQPWDKVYSEIRESLTNYRLLGDLKWIIDTDIVRQNEKGAWLDSKGGRLTSDYFVNPKTKLIQKGDGWRSYRGYQRPKSKPKYVERDNRTFTQEKGIWYECGLMPLPKIPAWKMTLVGAGIARNDVPYPYDAILKKTTDHRTARNRWGSMLYATMKRQISSKELKRFGLQNEEYDEEKDAA